MLSSSGVTVPLSLAVDPVISELAPVVTLGAGYPFPRWEYSFSSSLLALVQFLKLRTKFAFVHGVAYADVFFLFTFFTVHHVDSLVRFILKGSTVGKRLKGDFFKVEQFMAKLSLDNEIRAFTVEVAFCFRRQ